MSGRIGTIWITIIVISVILRDTFPLLLIQGIRYIPHHIFLWSRSSGCLLLLLLLLLLLHLSNKDERQHEPQHDPIDHSHHPSSLVIHYIHHDERSLERNKITNIPCVLVVVVVVALEWPRQRQHQRPHDRECFSSYLHENIRLPC